MLYKLQRRNAMTKKKNKNFETEIFQIGTSSPSKINKLSSFEDSYPGISGVEILEIKNRNKSFSRTDKKLKRLILKSLKNHFGNHLPFVKIMVFEKKVYLSGNLKSDAIKNEIISHIKLIPDVCNVEWTSINADSDLKSTNVEKMMSNDLGLN